MAVERLEAGYGPLPVLFGVDLAVGHGQVVALLGRNGAGKTTLLRCVMGLTRRNAGRILFDGAEIGDLPPHRRARLGIGWVPQERRIFPDLTVRENLLVAARPEAGRPERRMEEVLAFFPLLGPLLDRRGGLLSGGEQQLLAVARALMGRPRLLLLDEPTEGLAPVMVEAVAELLLQLRRERISVLLAEQNLRFASRVAEWGVVLQTGSVVLSSPMEVCARSPEVARRLVPSA
ncbi:MAG: ABC transporter ATP-binding protein [Firmicutes bacterium]|nr:ABC transporter ATP-binding protein [Bacillota bacterium]